MALKIFLLGPPRVELDAKPVDIKRRKALAMLVYLAVSSQPHSRDTLATLFYPDHSQSRARAYLRRDLAVLNTSLAGGWLETDRETVELKRGFWADVPHFQKLLAQCQQHDHPPEVVCSACVPLLQEATALYANEFLAGFTLRDCPEFDDWQFFEAESLRQDLATVLERLVHGLSGQEQYEAAIPHARRRVALDPLHEPAQRQLIQLYGQAGQPSAALRQYEEYVALLEAELGLPPEEETTTLYEAIKAKRMLKPFMGSGQASAPATSRRYEALKVGQGEVAAPCDNLPPQLTPFVGREMELDKIKQLLVDEPQCRLLTLVGPGGIGKTCLALEFARQTREAFPHGICFVSLASVSKAEFIVPAIAGTLNFTFTGATPPKSQLLNYLQEKQLLLLVDNIEHLLDGVEVLSDILNTAPQVKLLLTSRERLHLQEEWVYQIWGLAFSQGVQEEIQEELSIFEQYGAVQLFIQRARRTKADFTISAKDMPALRRICQLVDGTPLGLELAAPWVRLMTCQEIAAEIERNLDFLTTSLHNVSDRHRSLRAVFEQTWERLLPEEQAVLSKLSVFQGGCLREAAEAVTGATLPLLLSLVDKALLRRAPNGRFEMHELIRQFAQEQLQANPAEYSQALNQHYHYYTAFLRQKTEALKGSHQKETLEAISADIDNVRAAWHRAIEHRDSAALEQATECFYLYCEIRGALDEGEAAFRQAAQAFTADTTISQEQAILQGFLLVGQGMFRTHRGNLQGGQALLEQGLSLLDGLQEQPHHLSKRAFGLMWLGWNLFLQGKNAEAEPVAHESLDLFKSIGNRWGVAKNLFILGNSLTARGLLAESEPLLRDSLAIGREINDRRSCLLVNRNLAILTFWFGDYAQTGQLLDKAAALSQEFDDQIGLAYALRELGKLEVAEGKYEQAIQTLSKSIAITDEIGSRWESAATLDDLGTALRVTGDFGGAEQALTQCLDAAQSLNNRYYTARCWGDLGCLAYHRREYQRAEQFLRQALELWAEIGHEPYNAWVLSQLGCVMLAANDGRFAEARGYLAQALRLSIKHKLAPFALDIFVGVAGMLDKNGSGQQIAKLLSLASRHKASTHETKEKARGLLTSLAIKIPPEPPQTLDWQTTAGEVVELLTSGSG